MISRTAARRRRRARLRTTALPIFRVAVKPTRIVPARISASSGIGAVCSTKPGAAQRRLVAAMRKKSRRFGKRAINGIAVQAESGVVASAVVMMSSIPVIVTARREPRPALFRHSAFCGLAHAGAPKHVDRQRSSCGNEIHGGAFAPDCLVEMSASREFSIALKALQVGALYTFSVDGSQRTLAVLTEHRKSRIGEWLSLSRCTK